MPTPYASAGLPYPSHPPVGMQNMNPPSYAEAVPHPPTQLPTNELYAKQSPYNPSY